MFCLSLPIPNLQKLYINEKYLRTKISYTWNFICVFYMKDIFLPTTNNKRWDICLLNKQTNKSHNLQERPTYQNMKRMKKRKHRDEKLRSCVSVSSVWPNRNLIVWLVGKLLHPVYSFSVRTENTNKISVRISHHPLNAISPAGSFRVGQVIHNKPCRSGKYN